MATYTISLNERTASGKALANYLQSLGVLVKKAVPKKKAKADPTLMTKEELYAKIARAEQEYAEGKAYTMLPGESFTAFRRRIEK